MIWVDQKDLKKFVEVTEIDFPGKSVVLPDLAGKDRAKLDDKNLIAGFKQQQGAAR